jgi:hypothetical protein
MQYVIANLSKAQKYGFDSRTHRHNAGQIMLNEKEVKFSESLSGDFTQRVVALSGEVISQQQAIEIIKKDNWQ